MSVCDVPDCTEHYGCQLRRKGVRLSSAASPTMRNDVPPRTTPDPSWERGVIVDKRPRGEVMPLMDASASRVIRVHEYSSRRHEINDALRRAKGPVT